MIKMSHKWVFLLLIGLCLFCHGKEFSFLEEANSFCALLTDPSENLPAIVKRLRDAEPDVQLSVLDALPLYELFSPSSQLIIHAQGFDQLTNENIQNDLSAFFATKPLASNTISVVQAWSIASLLLDIPSVSLSSRTTPADIRSFIASVHAKRKQMIDSLCTNSVRRVLEGNKQVRLQFAQDSLFRYQTKAVLDVLATDSDADVRLAVALNRMTPKNAIQKMMKDPDSKVALAARHNSWDGRIYSGRIGERIHPLIYKELPEVRRSRQQQQIEQLHSFSAIQTRTYCDCLDAKSDLPRLFAIWEEHPYAVHDAVTNAIQQVTIFRKNGAPVSDVRSFFEECALLSFQLPIPTNYPVELQKSIFMFQASLVQNEIFSMKNRDGFSPSFAPELADLCARFKAKRDDYNKRITMWKKAEPSQNETSESKRRHETWSEYENLLLTHRDWAEYERQTIHLWLFDSFSDNWTSDGIAYLSPTARYNARLTLLRRANVDPEPFQSLSDEAMQCYRRETKLQEQRLATDENRRTWLWSRSKGSLGSGYPGRIETYDDNPPLRANLTRFRLTAHRFVRDPVEGAGRKLDTDAISNSIPFLLFTPKLSAPK
ncbi:MAG: hypothetical protein ACI4QT_04510, partial [Kiritimatiellia bacterium]